jgi:hypothetical protein
MAIVEPFSILVTRPDVEAMNWIRDNTAPGARFLVQGFRVHDGKSAVGSDAGWWIPLLAGRENTIPPEYALLTEAPLEAGYGRRVVGLVEGLEENSVASPEGLELLCDWGVTHVFIGQQQGLVGFGAKQLFSPQDLRTSAAFRPVYQHDRVSIFALNEQECPDSR